jgi:hypothetical protein
MTRKLAILLLLLAPAALGQIAAKRPFPDDYKPSPCAARDKVCKSFPQSQLAEIAAFRGFDIGQEWIDAHWKELMASFEPLCQKMATCFSTPGNDYLFCNDMLEAEARPTCNRYPEGSTDREKCTFFMSAYLQGIDRNSKPAWRAMQDCAIAQRPAGERTFDYWMEPARIDASYPGRFTVYVLDSETRVPLQANINVLGLKKTLRSEDVPNGQPTAFYAVPYKLQLVRVPNAQGHQDVAPPEVQIVAPGYEMQSFRLPIDVPMMKVEMTPALAKLKRGKNTVTITAVDAATGQPIEARVMAGATVLGKTNVPFELEVVKGQKRPEIWVTNLYDRYSDVVVAPAEK